MTIEPPNFAKRVGQFVQLRDYIKSVEERHKEELKKAKETLAKLNDVLMAHLNTVGADSVATADGTVYRTTKKSASIADMSAFWTYVVAQGDFDLLDKKANVTAVEAHIAAHNAPPPGVNYSVIAKAGVRRA